MAVTIAGGRALLACAEWRPEVLLNIPQGTEHSTSQRALLGPQGSASSGRGGGVRTTGQGTGTAWSREPRSPPSVGTTWRSQKGLAFGLKALTAPPLCWKVRAARFSQAAECPLQVQGPEPWTLAGWPSPASGTLEASGPLTTCWDGKGKGPRIAP